VFPLRLLSFVIEGNLVTKEICSFKLDYAKETDMKYGFNLIRLNRFHGVQKRDSSPFGIEIGSVVCMAED